jgi:hypothetical protein
MRIWIAGAAALVAVSAAEAAPAPPARVPPADIQKTFFTGQSFTASTPSNVKYTMVFMPDGKVTREPTGKAGVKGDGTWKLDRDGFCTTWKGSKPNCFVLLTSGENKWSVMKGSTVIAVWSK